MKKDFVLRVIDSRGGRIGMLTVDLNMPLKEQLSAYVGRCGWMKVLVSSTKDYSAVEVYGLLTTLGNNVRMEIVADTPETATVNAELYLDN